MDLMNKIGWWCLRHSKPLEKLYGCQCPKCKTFGWYRYKDLVKNKQLHSCGTKMEILNFL
jgi:hypothetical protein